MSIAITPKPPYYAVIFTSVLSENTDGYADMATTMLGLAQKQEGFIGVESARNSIGITVSYWSNMQAITKWKNNIEHLYAQKMGKEKWYKNYKTRIVKVESDYGMS